MQQRQARSTDPLYDMSTVAYPDPHQKDTTYATSYESQQLVLGPEMCQGNVQHAVVTYPSATLQDQTMQQVGYRVEGPEQLRSQQPWHMGYQQTAPWLSYAGNYAGQQMR